MDNDSQVPSPMPQMAPQGNIVTIPAAFTPQPEKPKSRKKIILAGVILLALVLFSALAGGVYAVAYEKVTLPDRELQKKITYFIMSLPFTPKTPQYVLEKAFAAQGAIAKQSFDVSVAIESSGLASSLGINNKLDVTAKGAIDYSDPKNIIHSTDISIPQVVSFKLRKPDRDVYIKVDQVGEGIIALLGVDRTAFEAAIANWVKYEYKSVITPASQYLDSTNSDKEPVSEKLLERARGVFKNSAMTSDNTNGMDSYKIVATLDEDSIKELLGENRVSTEYPALENTTLELYVGKNDYLVYRLVLNTAISPDTFFPVPLAGNLVSGPTSLAIVADFSDHSREITVEKPTTSITPEEFITRLFPSETGGIFGAFNPDRQFQQARDTQRRADLLTLTNAIYQYAAEHNGELPGNAAFPKTPTCIGTAPECFDLGAAGDLESIVPIYIAAIPADPLTGSSLNTGYTIYVTDIGRVEAKAVGELQEEITVVR